MVKTLNYTSFAPYPTRRAYSIHITSMCKAFARKGLKVNLIIPKFNPHSLEKIKQIYDIKEKNVNILISKHIYLLRVFSFLPSFIYKLIYHLEMFLFYFVVALKYEADIWYTRDAIGAMVLTLFGKKVIYVSHLIPRSAILRIFERHFSPRVIGIVTLSPYIKRGYLSLYPSLNEEKLIILPNAIDSKYFLKKKTHCPKRIKKLLKRRPFILMYVGSLYAYKGVFTLIDLANNLDSSFLLLIVGGTKQEIEKYTKTTPSNVIFIPFKNHNQIPNLLKCADVFLLPNSRKYGGTTATLYTSPIKLFEYMSTGKPIIASNLPAFRIFSKKYKNLFFFDPDNSKDMLRVLMEVYKRKPHLRDPYIYTWEDRVEEILNFLNKIEGTQ